MKTDIWDLSWCKQGNGYKYWSPPKPKTAAEIKENLPVKKPAESFQNSILTCSNCGAMTFLEIETCDVCSQPFPPSKEKPGPGPVSKQPRKMNVKEFEATKIELNRLKNELLLNIAMESPSKTKIKKLGSQINNLTAKLEANMPLALLFQPEQNYEQNYE